MGVTKYFQNKFQEEKGLLTSFWAYNETLVLFLCLAVFTTTVSEYAFMYLNISTVKQQNLKCFKNRWYNFFIFLSTITNTMISDYGKCLARLPQVYD